MKDVLPLTIAAARRLADTPPNTRPRNRVPRALVASDSAWATFCETVVTVTTAGRHAIAPPWIISGLMLVVIFITEYSVMITLPRVLPNDTTRVWESAIDAFLLTAIVSPLMWWMVVRPLQAAARLRERFVGGADPRGRAGSATDGDRTARRSRSVIDPAGLGTASLPNLAREGNLELRASELAVLAQTASPMPSRWHWDSAPVYSMISAWLPQWCGLRKM